MRILKACTHNFLRDSSSFASLASRSRSLRSQNDSFLGGGLALLALLAKRSDGATGTRSFLTLTEPRSAAPLETT